MGRRILILIGLLHAALGFSIDCLVSGNEFKVTDGGSQFSHRVNGRFQDLKLVSSRELCVLYDGLDFVAFSAGSGRFEFTPATKDYAFARLAVGGRSGVLYDGKRWYVFNGNSFQSWSAETYHYSRVDTDGTVAVLYDGKSFRAVDISSFREIQSPARARYQHVRLVAFDGIGALYDGDSLLVYEGSGRSFHQAVAKQGFVLAPLVAGFHSALLYDGEKLIGFCPKTREFNESKIGKLWDVKIRKEDREKKFYVEYLKKITRFEVETCTFNEN